MTKIAAEASLKRKKSMIGITFQFLNNIFVNAWDRKSGELETVHRAAPLKQSLDRDWGDLHPEKILFRYENLRPLGSLFAFFFGNGNFWDQRISERFVEVQCCNFVTV